MSNDNGNGQKSPEEIIQSMVDFMNHTNKILVLLKMQIDNMQIDIDNLKKDLRKPKNRVVIP